MEFIETLRKMDVKIHFPYNSISVDSVPRWQIEHWTKAVEAGKVFTVERGKTTFTVNPALVTHIEVSERLPF